MEPGTSIQFEVRTPVPQAQMRKNLAWALRQGFMQAPEAPERSEVVNIIANGPSALDAPLDGLTVALNGAMGLFRARGRSPTWWAACDPQGLVAGFVKDAPLQTTYLVASKCDRRVFRALRHRHILLWHIDDVPGAPWAVPSASSITLTALSLMRRMGFRKFRVWGWDGCYIDGRDHAFGQPHTGEGVNVLVGGVSYTTTTTWAVEAQDAVLQLDGADYEVTIEGPGMIGAIVRALVTGQR